MRSQIIGKIGPGPYKGIFSLALFAAIALMVVGWQTSEPMIIYEPPVWSRHIGILAVLFAILLMVIGQSPSRIRRYVRHPQLSGVMLWSLAHLLMNGDSRSLVLFGGIGLWALLEILLINRRDGPWQKPPAPSWAIEMRSVIIALVVFAVLGFAHPYFTGMTVFLF